MKLDDALDLVVTEFYKAQASNSSFHSGHEGYAVILEELDELKEEVWKKENRRDHGNMKKEAVQVAAMAVRFMVDLL